MSSRDNPESKNRYGLTKESMLSSVPVVLKQDPSAVALGNAIAEILALRPKEIDSIRILAQIDQLEEPLLGILAHDFKVDWWDSEWSLKEKRKTLKSSWMVHKRLGTKYAVKTALGAIFSGANIREWFEYGGEPYCFRVEIPICQESISLERQQRAISRIWYYKNLRSHLDSIRYTIHLPPATLRIGGGVGSQATLGVHPEPDIYDFQHTLYPGGRVLKRRFCPFWQLVWHPKRRFRLPVWPLATV